MLEGGEVRGLCRVVWGYMVLWLGELDISGRRGVFNI